MLEPALTEQVNYLHRELERQRQKLKDHSARLDEIVDILVSVQTMLDGMKKRVDKQELIFKAKPLEKEGDKEEIGVEGP